MSVTNQHKIGDRTYSFGHIPPTEAIRVEVAVVKVIGEPLFKSLVGAKGLESAGASDEEKKKAGSAVMGAALGLLAAGLDADELIDLMNRVFAHVSVNGKPISNIGGIDVAFAERNKREPWEVLVFALRFNFEEVFPDGLFASLAKKAKTAFDQ